MTWHVGRIVSLSRKRRSEDRHGRIVLWCETIHFVQKKILEKGAKTPEAALTNNQLDWPR